MRVPLASHDFADGLFTELDVEVTLMIFSASVNSGYFLRDRDGLEHS
jgi:hypothetical protein